MNGSEFAAKWSQNLAQAASNGTIEAGINGVKEAPGAAAARQKAKMLANLTRAVNDGTWERRVASVSLTDWQAAMKSKALPRIASGASDAAPKMAVFGEKLITYQNQNLAKIYGMPKNNLADSKNRLTAWFDVMSAFKGK